jgi:hypothetical protein
MKKQDLLAAIKGKPVPFTAPTGLKVDLRPLTAPERIGILHWLRESTSPDAGWLLRFKYAALCLCDGDGDPLFTEEEIAGVPFAAVDLDAIADEVARRGGLLAEKDQGKAEPAMSPATPS